MKIWTAIKSLDSRSNEWARRAVERAIVHLDQPSNGKKQPANRHIGVRDLLARDRSRLQQRASAISNDLSLQEPTARRQSAETQVVTSVLTSSRLAKTAAVVCRYPKFMNDRGISEIHIGAREFECIGASPPHDHPHVYIDMAGQPAILCPYCATRFCLDPRLQTFEAEPSDALFLDNGV